MSIGLLFWLLWILSLIFGGLPYMRAEGRPSFTTGAPNLLLWILLGLLGWAVFGAPIHD
jgi:hypothetical protein